MLDNANSALFSTFASTVACIFLVTILGRMGSPFVAKTILSLGLRLMGLTESWDSRIIVKDPRALVAVVLKGDLGFGEAFMEGKIDFVTQPTAEDTFEHKENLNLMAESALGFFRSCVDPATSKIYSCWLVPAAHVYVLWALFADWVMNLQSTKRSKEAISSHYDRATKVIECMTAPSYVYTCAHWGAVAGNAPNVTEAQRAKMALVCEKLLLPRKTPGCGPPTVRVLDIGCGYGALGKFMTENFNVAFTGVSISREQVAWANKHICHKNLEVVYSDYREMPQEWQFDAIVSVGMFEAVGPSNYAEFMKVHERHLKPDGLVVLHTITQPFSTRVNLSPWLIKYIFPDGTLPSLAQVFAACEKVLVPEDMHQFGPDYALTLEAWRNDWLAREDDELLGGKVEGVDTKQFRRMWWLYLTMCQALFEVRHANLTQFVFSKRGLRSSKDVLKIRAASQRIQDLIAVPPGCPDMPTPSAPTAVVG